MGLRLHPGLSFLGAAALAAEEVEVVAGGPADAVEIDGGAGEAGEAKGLSVDPFPLAAGAEVGLG
jgi:hypothetical protein